MEPLICLGHMDNGRVSAEYTGRANSRWLSDGPRSHTLLSLPPSPRETGMGVFTVSCLFNKITLYPFFGRWETGLKQPRLGLKLNTQVKDDLPASQRGLATMPDFCFVFNYLFPKTARTGLKPLNRRSPA